MRIGVAATAPIGADVLERLAATHEIAFLLTRPDARRGRGRKLAAPPAKQVAAQLGIPVHQPEKPALPEVVERMVVCAYGLYIPPRLLEQSLWLNVHPSLLPRWRGAAPVERALDAGPIAARESFEVDALDAGQVFARSAEVAARLLDAVVEDPAFEPQNETGVTYADKIAPADRELDLNDPIDAWRRVRALSPHIGAWTTMHGRRLTVWKAHLADGTFVPAVVQPEGRSRMSYDEFLRGVR